MALQGEVNCFKKKNAGRWGRKRKAALGILDHSGNNHLVQQQAYEGQVLMSEECRSADAGCALCVYLGGFTAD